MTVLGKFGTSKQVEEGTAKPCTLTLNEKGLTLWMVPEKIGKDEPDKVDKDEN